MRTESCQTNLSKLLPWLAGHALQGGDLTEELGPRLCWTAQQYGSSRDVVDHACLCADLGTLADVQVPRHCGLAANLDEILEHRRSRNAHLGDGAPLCMEL